MAGRSAAGGRPGWGGEPRQFVRPRSPRRASGTCCSSSSRSPGWRGSASRSSRTIHLKYAWSLSAYRQLFHDPLVGELLKRSFLLASDRDRDLLPRRLSGGVDPFPATPGSPEPDPGADHHPLVVVVHRARLRVADELRNRGIINQFLQLDRRHELTPPAAVPVRLVRRPDRGGEPLPAADDHPALHVARTAGHRPASSRLVTRGEAVPDLPEGGASASRRRASSPGVDLRRSCR